jgi:DNA-binding MarR family transcriptional regulator
VTLNTNGQADDQTGSRTRRDLVEDLLDEMTPWNPQERMSAFRSFLSGSLSLIHIHVLTILEVQGPLSMSRLAEEIDVSVASATGIVNRMEERRLVTRRHADTDRRVVTVYPTRLGSEVFARLRRHRRDKLKKILAQLSDTELAAFLTGLRAIRRARAAIEPQTAPEPTTAEPTTAAAPPSPSVAEPAS